MGRERFKRSVIFRFRYILIASVTLIFFAGLVFVSYQTSHADTSVTININDGKASVTVAKGDSSTFELTTTSTTTNLLGYTLSAFNRTHSDGVVIEKCNNSDCTDVISLSTDTDNPTEIDYTDGATTNNVVITKYKVTVSQTASDGPYNVTIGYYLAENKPPATATPQWVKSSTTVAGASANDIAVDKDQNMIPIVNKLSDGTYPSVWCNYDEQQWCNAVTVAPGYLITAQNASVGTEIPEDQILGYWVYIPRYEYQVCRPNASDPVTGITAPGCPSDITSQYSFNINFQKSNQKTGSTTPAVGDYVTHPAFTFGTTELNGLWVGKYEVGTDTYCYDNTATAPVSCGYRVAPNNIYIKPGQSPMIYKYVGAMFRIANNMGANQTTGGSTITNNTNTNTMNLATATTHQQKNDEWGAVVYLSTSIYGVYGDNNVFTTGNFTNAQRKVYNNGFYNNNITTNTAHASTYDTATTRYMTGCGPVSDKSDGYSATTCNQYYATLGQQASTTGNVYGLYDGAGGVWEYVMGNRNATSSSTYMTTIPAVNYFNNYTVPPFGTQPAWSTSSSEPYYNFDVCTFATCGGHANYETAAVQSISSDTQLWGTDYSSFVDSSYPWFRRGGTTGDNSKAGLFSLYNYSGGVFNYGGFRVVLSAF